MDHRLEVNGIRSSGSRSRMPYDIPSMECIALPSAGARPGAAFRSTSSQGASPESRLPGWDLTVSHTHQDDDLHIHVPDLGIGEP